MGILARLYLPVLAAMLLGACGSLPPQPAGYDRAAVVQAAHAMIGTPYRYGGANPSGFDCSGLVQYSFARVGKSVPRSTEQLFAASMPLVLGDVRAADLLFFRLSGGRADHVGIYIGEGRFIHAPSAGKRVGIASLDQPYWRARLAGARRI